LIKLSHLDEDSREYFLIHFRAARRRHRGVLPLKPASRVYERAILFGESRARQPIDGRVDVLHLVFRYSGSLPEFAGLIREDFAHNQPIRFLERVDVLFGAWTNRYAVHAEREQAFDLAVVHSIPHLDPGIPAIYFRQVMRPEIVFLPG